MIVRGSKQRAASVEAITPTASTTFTAKVAVEHVDEIAQDSSCARVFKEGIPGRETSGSMQEAPLQASEVCLKNQRNLNKYAAIYFFMYASTLRGTRTRVYFVFEKKKSRFEV